MPNTGNCAEVRERLPGMVIAPRDERDGAEDTRVPRRKGRVVAPRNKRNGIEHEWNNAHEQESAVKKKRGNREERVRRIEGRKGGQDTSLHSVTHLIFVGLALQELNLILKMRY